VRLSKLKIKNITSLKGEHLIDFGEIQRHSSLFAITGETGAGKSSILNCIGLALYGKVYKTNVNQNDLITLGEKDGQIELIFEVRGKTYLALWKTRVRKQNGEPYSTPQTPQRELYEIAQANFHSPRTLLSQGAEELLQLDFDQYCKCIILNQGEFARFLTSSFTERKDILEKLYPGEVMDSLSRELRGEVEELQRQKNDLDIELSTLESGHSLSEDLEAQKELLQKQFQHHDYLLVQLEEIKRQFITLKGYFEKNAETTERLRLLKNSLSQETEIFNQELLKEQRAQEELSELRAHRDQKLPRLQELLKLEVELLGQQEQLQVQRHSFEEIQTKLHHLGARHQEASERSEEWRLKSQELASSFVYPLEELYAKQELLHTLFDLYQRCSLLRTQVLGKKEQLSELRLKISEETRELEALKFKQRPLESTLKEVQELRAQKKKSQQLLELKSRAELEARELERQLGVIENYLLEMKQKSITLSPQLLESQKNLETLGQTLKLQELISAIEICLTHPSLEENNSCPVCHSLLSQEKKLQLKEGLKKTDFAQLKLTHNELARRVMTLEAELAHIQQVMEQKIQEKKQLSLKLHSLVENRQLVVMDPHEMDEKITQLEKIIWEQEKLRQDEEGLRAQLARGEKSCQKISQELTPKEQELSALENEAKRGMLQTNLISELSAPTLAVLKAEVQKMHQWRELKSQAEKLEQERDYLLGELKQTQQQKNLMGPKLTELEDKILKLQHTLDQELQGRRASELIEELGLKFQALSEALALREKELKLQEIKLRELKGRQYTLDELLKDLELEFASALNQLKSMAPQLKDPPEGLKTLQHLLQELTLTLNSAAELFIPLKDLMEREYQLVKNKTSELKMLFAEARARLEDWHKRQQRVEQLRSKSQQIKKILDRRERLSQVLGKDELRTFVLSLVEENLIAQTNEELQKLAQGRYEIIHQSRKMKLSPEFYILDKFRDGALRKVSTLSGGETFMVSLAMALALGEMARGQAEIDSLFIDEGFGTLDQESLEEVMDMLKQIQGQGLMIGIISHIKTLSAALGVNLVVSKKSDGTSSTSIILN
jgi:DNA repair protein SbcC/Rad50